ncbi:MAG: hypothetical protein ACRDZ1_14095, partial [Acidimicrobiia bacterium]
PPPGAPTPPPGAPPTGWVPPAARAQRSGLALGHGQIVALVGAGLVLLSGWLNWFEVEGGDSGSAYLVPAKLLIDNQITDDAGLNTGILVLLCAALVVAGALARQVPWLAVVGGGIAVVIALLFMFQVNGLASDFDVALFDFMGFAPLLTVLGGAAAVVGGVLVLSQPRRP